MNPIQTGGAAITGAMLGGVIVWLATVVHLTPPPTDVAGTMGAIVLAVAHGAWIWLSKPKTLPPPPTPSLKEPPQ